MVSETIPITAIPKNKALDGYPLGPDQTIPTDNSDLADDDDGLGPTNEDEDEPGLPEETTSVDYR